MSAITAKPTIAMWERDQSSASAAASTGFGPRAASNMRRRSGNVAAEAPPPPAVIYNPKVRSAFYQIALVLALVWLGYQFAANAAANLGARNIASGLGFVHHPAGFAANPSPLPYEEPHTLG